MALCGGQTFASLAELHAHLFISRGKSKDLRGMPPTDDVFKQHLLRSLLATHVQKKVHVTIPVLTPAPTFGWKVDVTHLESISVMFLPFPELTRSLTSCRCVVNAKGKQSNVGE